MKIRRISDIVKMINEDNLTLAEVAKKVKRSEPTIWRWVRLLRSNGHEIKTRKGGKLLL